MEFQDFKNKTQLVWLINILDQFDETERTLIRKISDWSNFDTKISDKLINTNVMLWKFRVILYDFWISHLQKNIEEIWWTQIMGDDFSKILSTQWTGFLNKPHAESDLLSICESFYSLLCYSKWNLKKWNVSDITQYFRSYTIWKWEKYSFDKIWGFRKYFSCLNWYYSNLSDGWSHRLIWGIYYNTYAKENDLPIINSLESQIITSQYFWENIDEFIDTKIVFIVPDNIFDTPDFRDDNLSLGLEWQNLHYYLWHKDFHNFYKIWIKEWLIKDSSYYKFSFIFELKNFISNYKDTRTLQWQEFDYAYKEVEQLLLDYDKKRNMLSNVL
jgi:hypothetical protein